MEKKNETKKIKITKIKNWSKILIKSGFNLGYSIVPNVMQCKMNEDEDEDEEKTTRSAKCMSTEE